MNRVYIVYGVLDGAFECMAKIHGVFYSRISAENFLIRLARVAFNEVGVPVQNRECLYSGDVLIGVIDKALRDVELYLIEKEVEE